MSDKDREDLYTIQQAAEYLKVHYQTIRNFIRKKQIKSIKIGRNVRIPASELQKLISHKIEPLEIELRFVLKNREQIEDNVRKLGARLTNHSHIIDHYYCDINISNLKEKDEFFNSAQGFAPRIRLIDNDYSGKVQTTIEVKKLAGPDFTDHSSCYEAEIDIDNYKRGEMLLKMMNFKRFITIDKERFVYRLGEVKFCFDSIKDWGNGLEIEKMAIKDYHLVHEELEKLAKKIGLKEEDMADRSFTYEAIKKFAKF